MRTLVAIPFKKELGLAYNDPYWYRLNNGLCTRAQAVQVQNHYNQTYLPPYGEHALVTPPEATAAVQEEVHGVSQTHNPLIGSTSTTAAPNLSVIMIYKNSSIKLPKKTEKTSTNTHVVL